MSKPYYVENDGWYIEIKRDISGPWNSEKAAEAAGDGNFNLANKLHCACVKRSA